MCRLIRSLICLCLAVCLSITVAQAQCAPQSPASVTLETHDMDVRYDFNHSSNAIKNLSEHGMAHDDIVRGLTVGRYVNGLQVNYRLHPVDGGYCVFPTEITAKLYWEPIIVYIENAYHTETCQHRAIMEHENKHVLIYRDAMGIAVQDAQVRLTNTSLLPPVFVKQESEAQDAIETPLKTALGQSVSMLDQILKRENAQLDAPDSINYTHNECSHW